MTNVESFIAKALEPFAATHRSDVGIVVPTHCLYPGGDGVTVTVVQGEHTFRVTDHGMGYSMLSLSGVDEPGRYSGRARKIAEERGLTFDNSTFFADEIDAGQLGAAILMVANASQQWVQDVLQDVSKRAERELRERVLDFVGRIFPAKDIQKDLSITGESTKAYQVTQAIKLTNDRMLLIETVTNHIGAIAPAYMKFSDLGRAHQKWPREFVVEKKNQWKAEDLNVLGEVCDGIVDVESRLEPLKQRYLQLAA